MEKENTNLKIYDKNLKNHSSYFPCLFLDRDGVIIKDCNYISKPSDVILEKGAYELIKSAVNAGWKIAIITNQSGIYRGYFSWEDYDLVTKKMIDLLEFPNPITAIYACGSNPKNKVSEYRKPSPKMIIELANEIKIDLKKSYLIGDRLTDLMAGCQSNLKGLFHVKTGHGGKEREKIRKIFTHHGKFHYKSFKTPIYFLDSLLEFNFKFLI